MEVGAGFIQLQHKAQQNDMPSGIVIIDDQNSGAHFSSRYALS